MGNLTKKTLGTPHGAFQDYVFAEWRGKAVFRARPKSISNPNTDAQISRRSRFKLITRMTSPLNNVIAVGFKDQAKYGYSAMTAINAFVQYNLKEDVFKGQGPDQWKIDYDKLKIAHGGLTGFTDHNLAMEGLNAVFTWTSDEYASEDDDIYCVMYNEILNLAKYTTVERSAGTATMPLRENWLTAGPTYCFIFAYNGEKSSDSIYLDSLE